MAGEDLNQRTVPTLDIPVHSGHAGGTGSLDVLETVVDEEDRLRDVPDSTCSFSEEGRVRLREAEVVGVATRVEEAVVSESSPHVTAAVLLLVGAKMHAVPVAPQCLDDRERLLDPFDPVPHVAVNNVDRHRHAVLHERRSQHRHVVALARQRGLLVRPCLVEELPSTVTQVGLHCGVPAARHHLQHPVGVEQHMADLGGGWLWFMHSPILATSRLSTYFGTCSRNDPCPGR